jgi:hypothetical protein
MKYPRVSFYIGANHKNTMQRINLLQLSLNLTRGQVLDFLLNYYEVDNSDLYPVEKLDAEKTVF